MTNFSISTTNENHLVTTIFGHKIFLFSDHLSLVTKSLYLETTIYWSQTFPPTTNENHLVITILGHKHFQFSDHVSLVTNSSKLNITLQLISDHYLFVTNLYNLVTI